MSAYALTLTDEQTEAVNAGRPVLPLDEVHGGAGIDPGRPVRLMDPRGEAIAAGLADPENQLVRVLSLDPNAKFNAAFFQARVEAAVKLRRSLGLIGTTTCRVVHAEGDRLSGFTADLFGEFAVVWVYSGALLEQARLVAAALLGALRLRGVVIKVRPRGGAATGQVKQETVGEAPPEKIVVEEHGVPYELHLLGGTNVGLFTDMREHRRGLARFVRGVRVLNTFAYTGSLSVAAARGGARQVTSVDLSSGVLKWAAENFRLSGLDAAAHRFEVSDVPRWLGKTTEKFDLIILDPPTVSAARASGWSMRKDYPDLIESAARALEPGGILWASANTVGERHLLGSLEKGLAQAERAGSILELGGLPPDYPTPLVWLEGRYLEVCLMRIS
jgi:23S rRNA (cytosine1962-C5)-methyltransferase